MTSRISNNPLEVPNHLAAVADTKAPFNKEPWKVAIRNGQRVPVLQKIYFKPDGTLDQKRTGAVNEQLMPDDTQSPGQ